jgi:CheY-like chemotaxis protein
MMSDTRAIDCRNDVTTGEHLYTELVLIVDDDNDILEMAAETLRTFGYEVLTARNGLEAIAILRKNSRVSTLFTDIQMPGMGGEELAEVAVALQPHIKVILTSGSSRPRVNTPFLQKPYRTNDLSRVFRSDRFHCNSDRGR